MTTLTAIPAFNRVATHELVCTTRVPMSKPMKGKPMSRKKLDDDLNRFYNQEPLHLLGFEPTVPASKPKVKAGPCYETHPPFFIPGIATPIIGGSCLHPVTQNADVYIGFDHGMRMSGQHFPWNKGEEFLFEIPDMGIPKKLGEFKNLVNWTLTQLQAGKKVHCGCIGGHGRTGTFLSALVCMGSDELDPIGYVRENYCSKAVETQSQVKFLVDHFGARPILESKTFKVKGGSIVAKPPVISSMETIQSLAGFSIWE